MDGGDAQVSGGSEERVVGAEEAVEGVGGGEHGEVVGAAAALIGGQEGGGAGILVLGKRGQDQVGQRYHVAEAEVEALAGDGVDTVGGVADEGQAGVVVALGVEGAERVEPAAADEADLAEMAA